MDKQAERPSPLLAPELMARVRQIQIRTHELVSELLQGAYRSTFRGTGIEFEEVRPYQPGDEVRSIDWNVTARTGEPFIKKYVEERQLILQQLILQLLVDTSLSMDFGSGQKTKREAAAEVAALLSFVASQEQDMVGLTLFDESPGLHLKPEKGSRHVLRVVREVMAAPARGKGSSLAAVLEHQVRHLRRRALIFIVSDFHDVDPGWATVLGRVARRHDVVCVRVFDPLEEELPSAGWITLREAETGRAVDVDTRSARVRNAWAEAAARRRAGVREAAVRARAGLIEVDATKNAADPVVAFFKRRARRARRR
jgi:uncharacterized protein (DUF58 family)